MAEPTLTLRTRRKGKTLRCTLKGSATIQNAARVHASLRSVVDEKLEDVEAVELEVEKLDRADVTLLQLVWALRRTLRASDISLRVAHGDTNTWPLAAEAGLSFAKPISDGTRGE